MVTSRKDVPSTIPCPLVSNLPRDAPSATSLMKHPWRSNTFSGFSSLCIGLSLLWCLRKANNFRVSPSLPVSNFHLNASPIHIHCLVLSWFIAPNIRFSTHCALAQSPHSNRLLFGYLQLQQELINEYRYPLLNTFDKHVGAVSYLQAFREDAGATNRHSSTPRYAILSLRCHLM